MLTKHHIVIGAFLIEYYKDQDGQTSSVPGPVRRSKMLAILLRSRVNRTLFFEALVADAVTEAVLVPPSGKVLPASAEIVPAPVEIMPASARVGGVLADSAADFIIKMNSAR